MCNTSCTSCDLSHYEELVPSSYEDVLKTVELTSQILKEEYIPWEKILLKSSQKQDCLGHVQNGRKTNNNHTQEPSESVACVQSSIAQNNWQYLLSLEELRGIPVKKRTKEQKKRYKHLMYLKSR